MAFINTNQRKKYFSQFKTHLLKRHKQNYVAYQQQGQVVTDQKAARFGRYLRATRVNAEFSQQDLAQKCGMPQATITALEQGLIASNDIEQHWLRLLSQALNEDIFTLALLLQRSPDEAVKPDTFYKRTNFLKALLAVFSSNIKVSSRPVYAALGSAIILCIAASALLFTGNIYPKETPPSYPPRSTLINVSPMDRMNMVKAEIELVSYDQEVTFSLSDKLLLLESQYAPVELSNDTPVIQPFASVY